MNYDYSEGEVAPYRTVTRMVYVLQILFFLSVITPLAAVAINYWMRDQVRGTWLESHFRWQIDTFWWFVVGWLAAAMGLMTSQIVLELTDDRSGSLRFVLVGVAVALAVDVWYLYRVTRGWSRLDRGKPMP